MMGRIKDAVRGAMRGFALDGSGLEAGRYSRRMSGWLPARDHVNTLISSSGRTTLARARYLVRNNSYAAGAVESFASNLVGAGIVPSWNLQDTDTKKALLRLWTRWTDDSDSEGVTDLYGQMRRIGRELFIAGECFVRRRPRYLSDGLSVPLQLQVLPSEMLPVEMTMPAENGNFIRQGIEFDKIGRRVAYHFWRVHPGDSTESPLQGQTTVVPADQVLHIFDPVEGGQIRGLSRLTPAIVSLWALDGYDDAELERKKTAALFTAFIKRSDPDGELFDKTAEEKAKSGDGIATVTLEPGRAQVLMPGEDVVTAAPGDVGPNYEAFQYRALTRVCAAMGLPYASVTGDLVRANYANQRAALIEMRRRMESLQHSVMVFQACRPMVRWFLDSAVLANAISLDGYSSDPAPYLDITWIPPRWDWVDPLKDRQAEILAVNAGFKARSMVIEAEGNDPAEVDARIAADQKRVKDLGITLTGSSGTTKEIASPPPDDIAQESSSDQNNPAAKGDASLAGYLPGPQ